MKEKSRMLLVLTLLVLLGGSLTISAAAYVTPPYSVAGTDSTGYPSSASANKNTGYLGADANAKGSGLSFTLRWAWGYVGETVVPSSDTHIKIGFTGTFHYDVNPLLLWPAGARAKVYVTLLDADKDELDNHLIDEIFVGCFDQRETGSISYAYTTTYNLDGEYSLQSGETYYACVKIYTDCFFSGESFAYMTVSKLTWSYY